MQLEARVKSSIELLDIFFRSESPFDVVLAKYFQHNKWIGANDRRAVAEFTYSIFRKFEKIKFLTSKITNDFGRFFVLAYLKSEKCYSISQIEEIFSGRTYASTKLSEFEKRFLDNLPSEVPSYAELNYPVWLEPYFLKAFGDENFSNEMQALNDKAFVDLRVNTLISSKDEVKNLLQKDFEVTETEYSDTCLRIINGRIGRGHPIIQKGLAEIQDEGSQLIAEACHASPGDTVVDFCAGAGGKTLALAAYMQNKGRLFALDKFSERLKFAQQRLKRAQVSNTFCQEITNKWMKRHEQVADVVLVDAPCSGSGTWRRNPDMRAKFKPSDLKELIKVQADILASAQKLVKPGGRLIYSTCSVFKEEDEEQAQNFLKQFPEFFAKPIELNHYNGDYLKLSPFKNKTDGFFAAVFQKSSKI